MLHKSTKPSGDLDALIAERDAALEADSKALLAAWPAIREVYAGDEYIVKSGDREIRTQLTHTTLAGNKVRKVALPKYQDHGELLEWLMLENVPGSFPYTAGVFAFKRENEDPTRMFAGEGDAFRTTRASSIFPDMPAKRLSTAFDSGPCTALTPMSARHLRQSGQFRSVDCDAGRHASAVFGLRSV